MIHLVTIHRILDLIQRKMTNKEYDNLIILHTFLSYVESQFGFKAQFVIL